MKTADDPTMIRTLLCLGAAMLLGACATAAATIPASDAASHVGQTVTVRGVVDEVRTGQSGVTYIDLDGRYPHNAFTVVVYPGGAAETDGWYGLKGRTAVISGKVHVVDGKPEIVALSPQDVRMLTRHGRRIARLR